MKIITFSGIDGAGKSTQISALENWLGQAGFRSQTLSFWDNVVVAPWFREFMSHKAFRGDKGIGSPEKPLLRRDKNVRSLPLTLVRCFLYLADAVNSRIQVAVMRRRGIDVLIFDRYIYDELANLPLHNRVARGYVRLVLKFVQKPDVALIIDADPIAARTRKPEYPLEFIFKNRQAYLDLAQISRHISVVKPMLVPQVSAQIRKLFFEACPQSETDFGHLPALE